MTTWLCVFTCLNNQFLQCTIFLLMKLWGFDNQRNIAMPWMLKGFLIASCLVWSKPCVDLFSLATLWFYFFCWFVGFLTCCYMWMGNIIFMDLLALCFHDPHWFSDHSLPSSWICFLFVFKNIISLSVGVGKIFMNEVQSPHNVIWWKHKAF